MQKDIDGLVGHLPSLELLALALAGGFQHRQQLHAAGIMFIHHPENDYIY